MEFEFDKSKSGTNKIKHGISFQEAKNLWLDEDRIIIPAKFLDEPRFLLIGVFQNKIWSAVYTIRESKIRIISVRRARTNERNLYES